MIIKERIQVRLKRSKRYVFIRDDFKDIAGYDQVGKILRSLVKEGQLLKVGYGVYTKARKNSITGKIMPASPGGSGEMARVNLWFPCYFKAPVLNEDYKARCTHPLSRDKGAGPRA
ncbi:DUF6088 family protein [Photorhabdus luminescens]|uniref:DUF6088 family protein n=1 Tax=Photorhabdus luminescens TaxID=29488 RepID=UPI001EFFA91E|nr:DUF6088 family protein [Photorhabdus luminescens]